MQFFKINPPSPSKFANIRESGMKYEPMCPVCTRGGTRLQPLSLAFDDDRPIGDFTWLAPDVLVSEKARDALMALGSEDFDFRPVNLLGDRQEAIWHLAVLAKCHIAPECGVQILEECSYCGRKVFSTWIDGLRINNEICKHDVFRLIEHWGMIFVSETVRKYISEQGLTNIEFIPIENVRDNLGWMRPRRE